MNAKEKVDAELLELSNRSERIGVLAERIRILDALHDQGSTGEFLELPWDLVLQIVNPDAE